MDNDPYDSDRFKNLPPDLIVRLKAQRSKSQAEMARVQEEYARRFKLRDAVQGIYRTPQGHLDPNSGITNIRQWQDDYGNTVYTRTVSYIRQISAPEFTPDQVRVLSEQIKTQQNAFDSLDRSEQLRIRTAFTSSGTDTRFEAYLTNEALGEQFQKLK